MISELVKSDKQKRMMKKLLIFIICICGAMASMQAQNMLFQGSQTAHAISKALEKHVLQAFVR